ncbi:MAG: hypothetical protein R3345_09780 [Fulvivirga sp.]|nr:hypothetical protein [Fulvivirga sp.]
MDNFLKRFIIITLLIIPGYLQAQVSEASGTYQNKNIPALLADEINEALSYFPELWKVKIDFIFKDKIKNSIMQAQPRVRTLLKKKEERTYKIKISRQLTMGDVSIPIEKVPHEILVGWIGHELGHIMDYVNRSAVQMVGFGINYMTSRKFLRNAELMADRYAIAHGLADHIIKTKNYILNHEHLSEDYKTRIDELYLSPEEVRLIESELNTGG